LTVRSDAVTDEEAFLAHITEDAASFKTTDTFISYFIQHLPLIKGEAAAKSALTYPA
jgi:hypothetical protein